MAEKKKVTIDDVAREAGVSKTTISRYINGRYEYMSEESRERIAGVIEKLNYRPNRLARSLKSKETKLLGVIVADICSPFSSIILKGISDGCERRGYRILIANSDNNYRKERDYLMSMLDQRVDGIILNTTGKNLDFLRKLYEEAETPVVLADRMIPEPLFDTVRSADAAAIEGALHYLKDQGYTEVGLFVEALQKSSSRRHRCAAYKSYYPEIFQKEPSVYTFTKESEDEALLKLFLSEHAEGRRAILTVNGVITTRLLGAVQNIGLEYPRECGILSFDDWPWMRLMGGGITAISQPTYEIGRECVRRMLSRLGKGRNAPPRRIELPCSFFVRRST